MGDSGLTVSGGGSFVVAGDAILARIDALQRCGVELGRVSRELLGISLAGAPLSASSLGASSLGGGTVPPAVKEARRHLELARELAAETCSRADGLYKALRVCLEVYGITEHAVQKRTDDLGAGAMWLFGLLSPLIIVPTLIDGAVGLGIVEGVTGGRARPGEPIEAFLRHHARILTNPLAAQLVRQITTGFGDGIAGFLHLPKPSGSDASLPVAAAAVLGVAHRLGLLRETGVTVRSTMTTTAVVPPPSLEERAARIPDPRLDVSGEQIRVDRYSIPGQPDRFDVYIAGTAGFAVGGGTQPFDMTSNIAGVAHESPASYRAVMDAMRGAGITPTSPVMLNGYSQGSIVASLVAASGQYDVRGIVAFGSPAGEIPVPRDIPVLDVNHTDDITPGSGGANFNPNALVIEREAFPHTPVPDGAVVPAHKMVYYEQTASLIDHAQSAVVRDRLDSLTAFSHGATAVTTTMWLAERTPTPAGAPAAAAQ